MATDSRSTPADPSAESSLGPPQEFRVPRAGDRDLAFKGRKIGSATTVTEDMGLFQVGVDVHVYVTEADLPSYITHVVRWAVEKGERSESRAAAAHMFADSAVEWLKEDAGGRLGSASKAAWESACRSWPDLASDEVEWVE